MCKIFGLTNTSKLSESALCALITRAHAQLTSTQRDGWGYALGAFSERWDSPAQWPGPNEWPAIRESLGGVQVSADCIVSGDWPGAGPALIAHARTATCARGAINAHPHAFEDWTLVHNGVVESSGKSRRSCDSMHIVESLAKAGGPDKLHSDLSGYLAILGTDPDGRFFALRDSRAPLYVARVPSLDAWAFASTPELLRSIVQESTPRPYEVAPYVWHSLTESGQWETKEVEPWAAYAALSSKASTAFGDEGDTWERYQSGKPSKASSKAEPKTSGDRWGSWRRDKKGRWTNEPPSPADLKGATSKFPDWPDK